MPGTTVKQTHTSLHEAEQYLRDPQKPNKLYIQYNGSRRRLFINKDGAIGVIAKGKRKQGYLFSDWDKISKIYYPVESTEETIAQYNIRINRKYKLEASKAGFTNPFIRSCLNADEEKCPYENGISGGSCNEGKIITLDSIRKAGYSFVVDRFISALKEKREYNSASRFKFRGYECTLSVGIHKEGSNYTSPGDVMGYLSLEYKNCLNGYYYLLINEDKFIGYDKD